MAHHLQAQAKFPGLHLRMRPSSPSSHPASLGWAYQVWLTGPRKLNHPRICNYLMPRSLPPYQALPQLFPCFPRPLLHCRKTRRYVSLLGCALRSGVCVNMNAYRL